MRRRSLESWRRAWAVSAVALVSGCSTVPLVTMHDVWDANAYRPIEQNLSPAALERNMAEIDAQYAEPRTPAKVALSLETAEVSTSPNNSFAALWRGAK